MNNLRKAQAAYDAMTPNDPMEYRDSSHYLNWIEVVTKQIISGDRSYGIYSDDLVDVLCPLTYVFDHIDDSHYLKYCEAQRDYD